MTLISFLHPPHSHKYPPLHTHCVYFTVLVFIINFYVDIQRGVWPLWVCFTLGCLIPSIALPLFLYLPPHPRLSTVFKTHPCNLYLNILCCAILLMLYHSVFLFLFLWVPYSSSTVTNMLFIWVCIWSCLFLCICLHLNLSSMYEIVAFVFLILVYFT
jgi:hypothetical protein